MRPRAQLGEPDTSRPREHGASSKRSLPGNLSSQAISPTTLRCLIRSSMNHSLSGGDWASIYATALRRGATLDLTTDQKETTMTTRHGGNFPTGPARSPGAEITTSVPSY